MKKLLALVLIISLLSLFSGCSVTGGALVTAGYEGQTTVIKDLLDKGGNVDERGGCGLWSAGGDFGATPLLCAALGGHIEAVKVLIDRGADVNAKANGFGSIGQTPLTAAAYGGHADIAKLLIERGADIDYALAKLEKWTEGGDGFKLLERLAKTQQPAGQPAMPKIAAENPASTPTIKSDVDELPASTFKPNKNAYAIVIGIEQYREKLPKADFADRDALLMGEYLIKVLGYPEENVVVRVNEKAAKTDLEKYFEGWLPNNAEKDSSVFIYYSGHGAPNTKSGEAYHGSLRWRPHLHRENRLPAEAALCSTRQTAG